MPGNRRAAQNSPSISTGAQGVGKLFTMEPLSSPRTSSPPLLPAALSITEHVCMQSFSRRPGCSSCVSARLHPPGPRCLEPAQVAALASVFCESRLEKALVSVVSRAKRVAIQDQQRVSPACDFSVVESRALTLLSGLFSLSKPGWRDSLG